MLLKEDDSKTIGLWWHLMKVARKRGRTRNLQDKLDTTNQLLHQQGERKKSYSFQNKII